MVSMCLLRSWRTGFFVRAMADLLSTLRTGVRSLIISLLEVIDQTVGSFMIVLVGEGPRQRPKGGRSRPPPAPLLPCCCCCSNGARRGYYPRQFADCSIGVASKRLPTTGRTTRLGGSATHLLRAAMHEQQTRHQSNVNGWRVFQVSMY